MQTVQAIDATRVRLQEHLNILHQEALLNRAIFQQGKAAGLAGLVLGGIGCLAFPPLGIVSLASGIGLWAATALTEGSITGNLCPLPWVSTRLTDLAARLDRHQQNVGLQVTPEDLELTDYLPPHDRVAYLLILCQGNKLAEILGQLEPAQLEATFAAIVQKMLKIYGSHGLRLEEAMNESAQAIAYVHTQFQELKALPPTLGKQPPTIQPEPKLKPRIMNGECLGMTEVIPDPFPHLDDLQAGFQLRDFDKQLAEKAAVESLPDTDDEDVWAMPSPAAFVDPMAGRVQIDPFCDVRSIAQSGYIESVIWLGASRSGKTVAADQLFQEYKTKYQTLKAWYCTPVYRAAADANELSLFEGATVGRYDLLNEANQEIISTTYAHYENLLNEFLKAPSDRQNPKLFICDELSIHFLNAFPNQKIGYPGNEIAARFYGKFINALSANASGGKAVGIGLWGLAPIGAVGGLGLSRHTLSATTPVFVAHVDAWNGAVWKGAKTNDLAPSSEPTEDFKRSVRDLGGDRIVSIGCNPWRPLKNYIKEAVTA